MSRKDIIRNLLQENIVLATGCTEPVAVALCVAKAKELLEEPPAKVELFLRKFGQKYLQFGQNWTFRHGCHR